MFNDDAGFELVNLQAQRDLNSLVKNDETRTVNRDRTTTIDNDETVTVHGKRTEVVDKDEHITIHQNRTEIVDQNETITIHQNRQERVDENETLDIGGNRIETVHKSENVTIKGNRDKTVKGNDTLTVNKNRKETVNKSRSLKVDKNNTELVKMAKSVTVGLAYATQVGTVMNTAVGIMQAEEIGAIKKTLVGKSYSISVGDKFEISVGSSKITMTEDSISITAKTILVAAENKNVIIGKDVLINPPGAVGGGGEETSGVMTIADSGEAAQIGADGLPVQGSDSDEMTDEELYALNEQMIEEAVADGSIVAKSKYADEATRQFMERQAGDINSSVMNNNGSIYSGSMPAYQQAQNKKTFDATVTIVSAAAGTGSATILIKGSRYIVSKSALNLAKQGKTSINALIKVAKKAVPNTTSIPKAKAMAGGAGGSAVMDIGFQTVLNPDKPLNLKHTAVSTGVGVLGGVGGSVVANAAKVPYATALNLPKVYTNTNSMKILAQQKAAETVGKTAGKKATDD